MYFLKKIFSKSEKPEKEQLYYSVERKISIDMGHRVYTHGSKCFHIHGHTYIIYVRARSKRLIPSGTQKDMVIDFSFLKESMLEIIDRYCDHGLVLSVHDPISPVFYTGKESFYKIKNIVADKGFYFQEGKNNGQQKLYLINSVPTAERLAEHWFSRLQQSIFRKSGGNAEIVRVRVWETPNCFADFPDR